MATDRPLSRMRTRLLRVARCVQRAARCTAAVRCTQRVSAGCKLLLALGCAHVRDQRRSIRRSVRLHRPAVNEEVASCDAPRCATCRVAQRATYDGVRPVPSAGIGTGSSAGEAWHCEHCGAPRVPTIEFREVVRQYLIELCELVPVGGVDLVVHVLARLHVPARVEVPNEQPVSEYCSPP
jgi:hypothetical protein